MYYLGVFTYSYFYKPYTVLLVVLDPRSERELAANYLSTFGVHNTSGLKSRLRTFVQTTTFLELRPHG